MRSGLQSFNFRLFCFSTIIVISVLKNYQWSYPPPGYLMLRPSPIDFISNFTVYATRPELLSRVPMFAGVLVEEREEIHRERDVRHNTSLGLDFSMLPPRHNDAPWNQLRVDKYPYCLWASPTCNSHLQWQKYQHL